MARFDVYAEDDPSNRLATLSSVEEVRRFTSDRGGGHAVLKRRLTGLQVVRDESTFTTPAMRRPWVAATDQRFTRRFAAGAVLLGLAIYSFA